MTTRRMPLKLAATVAVVAMLAAGCGSSGDNSSGEATSGSGNAVAEKKDISIGVIPGWTDEVITAYIFQNVLNANGYNVKITELSDAAPMYTAVARGNLDVLGSGWIEKTHLDYWNASKANLEDLGVFYDGAKSFLAVPKSMTDVNSIEDLPAKAAEFNNTVTGIEPGAGLTKMTKEAVIPGYGLDKAGYKLQLSSTPAMLTALKQNIAANKPIVITMWSPFWANSSFEIKPLEDPKGLYGKPENLHVIAHKGFSSEAPKAAMMMGSLKLTQEQYENLENSIVNDFPKGQAAEAVAAWLKANPEVATNLAQQLK